MKTITAPKPKPDEIKIKLKVNPEASAAMLALSGCPEGYLFVSMKRVGDRAIVTYRRQVK